MDPLVIPVIGAVAGGALGGILGGESNKAGRRAAIAKMNALTNTQEQVLFRYADDTAKLSAKGRNALATIQNSLNFNSGGSITQFMANKIVSGISLDQFALTTDKDNRITSLQTAKSNTAAEYSAGHKSILGHAFMGAVQGFMMGAQVQSMAHSFKMAPMQTELMQGQLWLQNAQIDAAMNSAMNTSLLQSSQSAFLNREWTRLMGSL